MIFKFKLVHVTPIVLKVVEGARIRFASAMYVNNIFNGDKNIFRIQLMTTILTLAFQKIAKLWVNVYLIAKIMLVVKKIVFLHLKTNTQNVHVRF